MEQALDELAVVCGRAHSEEKSGTRERSILSVTAKNLRRCLQEADAHAAAAPADALGIRRRLLTSAEDVSRLAYAGRVSLVGDRLAVSDRAVSGGSVSRGSPKALTASLELAAVLLNSGIVPTALWAPAPVFDVSQGTSGGAHAFFSKILGGHSSSSSSGGGGGGGGSKQAKAATAATSTGVGPARGGEGSPVAANCSAAPSENVRDALVDAVVAAAPAILARDLPEKLVFLFVTTLGAAAVPQVSRTSISHLGETPDELRYSCLAVHSVRLVRVMQLLFTMLTRQSFSPVLVDEVRSVLQQIVKSLTKSTELEIRSSAVGGVGALADKGHGSGGRGEDVAPPGTDLVRVLELCCAVCRVAPLQSATSQPSGAAAAAAAQSLKGLPADEDGSGTVTDASVAAFATYPALSTSLGFILHIIVNGGHLFRRTDNVIECIRQRVVPAAVRTSVSTETDVFRLSLNILLTCGVTCGPYLVNETSTVFRHVYFRVLESKLTSFLYKSMVIEAFQRYIEEPQNLIALFLNYDCNTNSQSIYEEMISYLSAMAKLPERDPVGGKAKAASVPATFSDPREAAIAVKLDYEVPEELRRKAMQALLLVAESNIQWIERFETNQGEAASNHPSQSGPIVEADAGNEEAIPAIPASASRVDAGEDAEDTAGAAGASSTITGAVGATNSDAFLEARRYKDALRKFYYLFNEKSSPESAIEYLKSHVLGLEKAREEDSRGAETLVKPQESTPDAAPTAAAAAAAGKREVDAAADGEAPNPSEEEVREAARVARFLYDHEDWIDKIVLGEYFAKSFRKIANRLVFEEWIKLYDFTGLKLDEALRRFLGGFKLLGEAQIVDRTMELFAAQYCGQNPAVFTSADTAFILSFSICMLNTDAHSSHIKEKMTLDGFVRNNKGIDEGNDVDPAILSGIYNRIVSDEIVLRPSKYVARGIAGAEGRGGGGGGGGGGSARDAHGKGDTDNFSGGVLESIPLLRHLAPIANVITDKVLLPMDAMGSSIFGSTQRKREEKFQEDLRAALREVTEALRTSASLPHAAYVAATSIENALPMWEVTVDILCHHLMTSLYRLFEESEEYVSPSVASQVNGSQGLPLDYDPVAAYMRETGSYEYFQILLRGLTNTVRVCCSYGNVAQTEMMLELCFQMTLLSQTVVTSTRPALGPQVQITQVIPRTRLELLVTFLNLCVEFGTSFGMRGWQAGYAAVSLVDALANGVEGLWRRQSRRVMESAEGGLGGRSRGSLSRLASMTSGAPTEAGTSLHTTAAAMSTNTASTAAASSSPTAVPTANDMWFGVVRDCPASIAPESRKRRENILNTIRIIPGSAVDLWVERLFDATRAPAATQLQMAYGLAQVSQKELQHGRTFTLTKFFDFVTVCASISTRLQWRELWTKASTVFVLAGCMGRDIASEALDGLRIIALTYLVREELLNYSFQKEVMKPLEDILMGNQDVMVRRRVISIMSELIDVRAGHLASGWNVVFTCLSHAAVIPEVVGLAWELCERVMALHVDHMRDCFSDLIFCLTTFACTNVDEQVPLKGISYLVACGHWLQYGLEAPPDGIREAADVLRWAGRYPSAEAEAHGSRTLGKYLPRVAVAPEPLTALTPLTKPATYVAKTNYHLWMSLFEGLIPIVIVHASARVRAHAVCCIWNLLHVYAPVFAVEVQDSLFAGTLRPVLATLLSHVPRGADSLGERADYRMLAYLALKGLLLACKDCAHLLELCCETMYGLVTTLSWTDEVVENDLVDVWVRVCCDALGAVATSAAHKAASGGDLAGLEAAAAAAAVAAVQDASPLLHSSRNASFVFGDRSLPSSFAAVGEGAATGTGFPWMPQPSPERKAANPFFIGLMHEVQQMGAVDVLRFKRTASWTELHVAAAAGTAPVLTLGPRLQTYSLTSLLQGTVFRCLREGLLERLIDTVTHRLRDDRARCLVYARAVRRAMLGLSFYCAATGDAEGVCALLDVVHRFAGSPHTGEERRRGSGSSISSSRPDLPGPGAAASDGEDASGSTPVELLLSVPYVAVLLEFVFAFPIELPAAGRRLLRERISDFHSGLCAARQFCVEQQEQAQQAFEREAAGKGVQLKPYKGRSFADVFRSGRAPIEERVKYYTPTTAPELRRRVFHEWKFLTFLLAIRCSLVLGESSILWEGIEVPELLRLIPALPSDLEEAVVSEFTRSCWGELGLHCNMPEMSALAACLAIVESRLQRGAAPDG